MATPPRPNGTPEPLAANPARQAREAAALRANVKKRKEQARARQSVARAPTDDPVLVRLRKALGEMYGPRLERVVLFGSRARGDARPDSDYDVAVFLRDMGDRFEEIYRLADLGTDILDETGGFVHATPHRAGAYDDRTPLMREIRIEGVDL